MIEAACPTCGNTNRVAEVDVPVGAKFINCATCTSRVPLPQAKPPATRPETIASRDSLPASSAAEGRRGSIGLADLPMAKRAGSLGPDAKPAPSESVVETTGLPAPRGSSPRPAQPGSLELDDFLAPAPAPAKPVPASDLPQTMPVDFDDPTTPRIKGIVELPAPKPKPGSETVDLLGPKAPPGGAPGGVSDLPAPKQPIKATPVLPRLPDLPDLPAPRRTATGARLPSGKTAPPSPREISIPKVGPVPKSLVDNLPQPAPSQPPVSDLPAPQGLVDNLPQPAPSQPSVSDLPAPKGLVDNLPQPAPSQPVSDLPAPKHTPDNLPQPTEALPTELPAPKNVLDDPLQPVPSLPPVLDMPASKGFFEDLPQPAPSQPPVPDLPAPEGFFEDLPQPASPLPADLPALKGFFEDLPQPALSPPSAPDLPAPEGFFDDLPQPALTPSPASDLPAPKGFVDDLSDRPHVAKPELPAPVGFFDDLPGEANPAAPQVPQPRAARAAEEGLDLELAKPTSAPSTAHAIDDLETAPPPPAQEAKTERPSETRTPVADVPERAAAGRPALQPVGQSPQVAREIAAPRAPKVTLRPVEPQVVPEGTYREPSRRRRPRVLLAMLLLVALGAGGFVFYQRYQAQQQRAAAIQDGVQRARTALAASEPEHWMHAAAAARKVLELDEKQPQALGIGAEAYLASALADGTLGATNKAKTLLQTATDNGLTGPEIERASALQLVWLDQADRALLKLQALAAAAPSDPTLALYVGWAFTQSGNAAEAVKAFDRAMQSAGLKVPALYARARAKLTLVDLDGARADFAAILELAKDHVGAQVGLAAARPAAQAAEQEADALTIVQRKDLASADPRAVAQAWTLAAEAARRSNRLDVARDRFRKALGVLPDDVAALAGLAEVELHEGKLDAAAELINHATTQLPNDMHAQLLAAELEIGRQQLDGAAKRLELLAARTPPPPPLDRARLKHVTGKLLDAKGDPIGAVDAYVEASQLAGDLDLAPLLAAVSKLTDLAKAADGSEDKAKADALRARADGLLGAIAANARKDAQLALTLGIAYLQVGAADKAEPWLRQAVDARRTDADAHYQLAKALVELGRNDAAIASLKKASELDSEREEIGIELARTYEANNHVDDAAATYERLLSAKDPSLELRARAGRFYARIEQFDKAAAQGAKILEVDRASSAGYYLKAEGLLAAGELEEARKLFQLASEADKDPQYFDGLGRAAQLLSKRDSKYQDAALHAYMAAADADPQMLDPRIGMATLYIDRREFDKAVPPLLAAYKIKDTARGALLLGRAYKELSQSKVAIEWLEHSLKLEPSSATYYNLGIMYSDTNQGTKAASTLATACRLGVEEEKHAGVTVPWLTEALYYLGRVNSDLHNDGAARDAWGKFVARNPPDDARLREVREKLATELRPR